MLRVKRSAEVQRRQRLAGAAASLVALLFTLTACGNQQDTRATYVPISDHVRIFRLDAAGLPEPLAKKLSPAPSGVNWSLEQLIEEDVWAVPARDRVCIVQQESQGAISVTCTRPNRVISHGIFVASLKDPSMHGPGPRREIVGLAPDGTHRVRLITSGHKTVTIPVRRNVFVQRDNIPASPQTVTLLRD